MAVAALLAACGGDSSADENRPAGNYDVRVTSAGFPAKQHLGETSLMRLAVRNTGEKTVPALTVTISIAGELGETSSLPFGVHDPQPGLAQPDRPVWVLSAHYPKLGGSSDPGGASTASPKTFSLGSLKPGATTRAVWKLNAVRAGRYTVRYEIGAGIDGAAKARTTGGVTPGGSFVAEITAELPETEVTDSGEVVEKKQQRQGGKAAKPGA